MVSLFREPDEPKLGQRRWPKLAILLVAVRLVQLCFLQLCSLSCRDMAAPYWRGSVLRCEAGSARRSTPARVCAKLGNARVWAAIRPLGLACYIKS